MTNLTEKSKPLNERQRAFVRYYRKTGDRYAAALRAGYAVSSVSVISGLLLKDERVQAALGQEAGK